MSASAMQNASEPAFELKITRTFDAPRELVWKAWTDPEMSKQWMGPRGFQTVDVVMPLKPESEWKRTMEGRVPGLEQMACLQQHGKTLEVVPPEKLVFTFAWGDRSSVGLGDSPYKENIVTVLLEEQGSKTVLHFTQGPFATEGERDGHTGGWNSSFDKFAVYLETAQPTRLVVPGEFSTELHLRRTFAAPRQMVFDAWMTPEAVEQWWGPNGFQNRVLKLEPRAGGAIHFELHGPDGSVYPMTGRFLEIHPPFRFHFLSTPLDSSGEPLFELWTSVVLQEVPDGTELLLDVHVKKSRPEGAMHLRGMRQGWTETLNRLGGYVEGKK